MINTELIAKKYGFTSLVINETLGGFTSKNYSAVKDNKQEVIIKIYEKNM